MAVGAYYSIAIVESYGYGGVERPWPWYDFTMEKVNFFTFLTKKHK